MEFDTQVSSEVWIVTALVLFTMVMFVWERLRADVTALLVLVVLGLTGVVPVEHLFDGFSGNAVMSVIATMILGAGLDRTGLLNRVAVALLRAAKGYEERLILYTSAAAGAVSSVMQNPSVTALFLPVAARLSSRTGIGLGRLLLPIATCIVLGGSLTMVGSSPMILLNDLLVAANRNLPSGVASLKPLGMFAPLPFGLALLAMGLALFRVFGKRWFGESDDKGVAPFRTDSYFARTYGISGDVYELTVTADSPLVGMSIGEAEVQPGTPLILALRNGNESRLAPPADEMIWVGSTLGVMGERDVVQAYADRMSLRLHVRMRYFNELFNPSRAGISEAVVPPNSRFIGQVLGDLRLRKQLGISVLAVYRGSQVFREDLRRLSIRVGDLLVFHSIWSDLAQAAEKRDFVVVTDYPKDEQRPHKLWHALGVFVISLGLALSHEVAVPVALMAGVVGMLLTGVLNMDEAYAAVNWKTVFVMASLIPLGWAVDSSGLASQIASALMQGGSGLPVWLLQLGIALFTVVLGLVVSNVGATVIMVPIAINMAISVGAHPVAFAMVVALSASNNFINASNPVLSMITGPAGYSRRDLLRAGLPLTLAYLLVVQIMVALLF